MDANERMLIRGSVTFRIFADSTVSGESAFASRKSDSFSLRKDRFAATSLVEFW